MNKPVDRALAERLHEQFVEVLIAPGYEDAALEVLQQKEAIRILEDTERRGHQIEPDIKRVRGGLLVQDPDGARAARADGGRDRGRSRPTSSGPTCCSRGTSSATSAPTRSSSRRAARRSASAPARCHGSTRSGSVEKARDARGPDAETYLGGSALASDAFFPFADGPQSAIDAGVTSIIQPGGSKRDAEVIEACDAAGVPMVFTKRRHFRH